MEKMSRRERIQKILEDLYLYAVDEYSNQSHRTTMTLNQATSAIEDLFTTEQEIGQAIEKALYKYNLGGTVSFWKQILIPALFIPKQVELPKRKECIIHKDNEESIFGTCEACEYTIAYNDAIDDCAKAMGER